MVIIYTHDKLKEINVFKYSPHPQLHEEKVFKKEESKCRRMQSLHQNEKSSFLSIRLRADKRKSDHSLILRFASLNALVNKLTLKAKYKFITSNSDAQVIKKKNELSTECVL